MKRKKYIYVNFEGSRHKYLYNFPPFNVYKGNIVKVEASAGINTAIIVKIARYKANKLSFKGELKNIVEVIDKGKAKNLKAYQRRLYNRTEKQWRYITGFKKKRISKYLVVYTYKNLARVSAFYLKSDNSWIIDFNLMNSESYTTDGFGKIAMKNTLYKIMILQKNYTKNLLDEENFISQCEEISTY